MTELNELKDVKIDIKNAITSKGVTPKSGMITYANCIRRIGLKPGGYVLPNGTRLAFSKSSNNINKYNFLLCDTFDKMFYASSFTTFPKIDTDFGISFRNCFYMCNSLTSIALLNFCNALDCTNCFNYCYNLTTINGFFGLGIQPVLDCTNMFKNCNNITRQSCINIFNNLHDRELSGYSTVTLQFEQAVLNRLTDNDIAIATKKGWIIS